MANNPMQQFSVYKIGPEIKIAGIDLSFTNASLFMVISASIILLFLFLGTKKKEIIPNKIQLIAEMFYTFVAKMISDTAGSKAKPYFPFIFSSSCTVYGQADQLPIDELTPTKKAESPYGNTKQIGEEILYDESIANKCLRVVSLRYFNPIGAHPSNEIGELPFGKPQNLVPFITQTAAGIQKKLSVFGDDYPTTDGTCIRDYIHVVDLAKAHIIGLKRMTVKDQNKNFEVFNLGTGRGNTVLEVIKTFEKISGRSLNYEISPRRKGDITAAYADTTKANKVLGWKAELSLEEALISAWRWEKKIRKL